MLLDFVSLLCNLVHSAEAETTLDSLVDDDAAVLAGMISTGKSS
jgi:hypothetical protein